MKLLLAACVKVALARHLLECPNRLPDRVGRQPQAAILPAPGEEVTAPAESAGYQQRQAAACIQTQLLFKKYSALYHIKSKQLSAATRQLMVSYHEKPVI